MYKDTHITPDKEIVEGQTEKKLTNAAIGDTINFKVTIPIPDTTEYNNYKFVMNDTLSKGLTFKEITSIKIDNIEQIVTTDAKTADGKIDAADLTANLTNVEASIHQHSVQRKMHYQ